MVPRTHEEHLPDGPVRLGVWLTNTRTRRTRLTTEQRQQLADQTVQAVDAAPRTTWQPAADDAAADRPAHREVTTTLQSEQHSPADQFPRQHQHFLDGLFGKHRCTDGHPAHHRHLCNAIAFMRYSGYHDHGGPRQGRERASQSR
ncbi:hypothetical protein [Streptomyces sp. NPDC059881]|uniref:hypothetical protein n=1 Tax=Streptomyces sp. NPDC059881 TaxID=3346986 RepID=UPI003659E32E